MIKLTCESIIDELLLNQLIEKEKKDIYIYGLINIFTCFFNILITILMALVLNSVLESIIFSLTYIPIRSYAGGYHARTQGICYIFSIFLNYIVLKLIQVFSVIPVMGIITILFSGIVILILSPVSDRNKPLDRDEIIIFRRRSLKAYSILMAAGLVYYICGKFIISTCIGVSLLALSVMLIIGKFKNLIENSQVISDSCNFSENQHKRSV